MLTEFLLSSAGGLLLGILAGTLTGLTPGIHLNLVAALTPLALPFLPPTMLVAFIIALAVAHTFIDTIPSIYLGAPDEETALSTLPGHKMLKMGLGHTAVRLTIVGSVIAVLLLLVITPLFMLIIPKTFPFIERMMGFFLIQISLLLIYFEKEGRIPALIVFALAGFLGIATLNLPLSEPLLPLLTGLFGTSTLIYSIKSNTVLPKQLIEKLKLSKEDILKPTAATTIVSPICSFFPGLGSSQSAIIGSHLFGNMSKRGFLVLVGSTNTLVIAISFITILLIGKARTGAASALMQITTPPALITIPLVLAAAALALPLAIFLSRGFAKHIDKISYTKLSLVVLVALTLLVTILSGFLGLLVLTAATITGLTCIELGVRRGFLMGALLIPTTLFYLPF